MNEHANTVKYVIDASAAATAFASFIGWLPSIASLLSIIWLVIQIGEWWAKKRKEK